MSWCRSCDCTGLARRDAVAVRASLRRWPNAHREAREVLIAATLQGAVFGLVKPGMDRIAVKSFHRFTRD